MKISAKNHYCNSGDPSRYRALRERIGERKPFFYIAVNFFNNQAVIPDFILQLEALVHFLGAENVYVSVYENGSEDQTKTYLHIMRKYLDYLNVANTVHFSFASKDPAAHRIEVLSRVRNMVLEPFFQRRMKRHVEKVIFMNDIFFCADDIKELLHQSYIQKSDLTCGLDFDTSDGVGFYDTWYVRF